MKTLTYLLVLSLLSINTLKADEWMRSLENAKIMAAKQPLAEQVDVSKYKSGGKGCVGSEGGGRLGDGYAAA